MHSSSEDVSLRPASHISAGMLSGSRSRAFSKKRPGRFRLILFDQPDAVVQELLTGETWFWFHSCVFRKHRIPLVMPSAGRSGCFTIIS